MKSAKATIAASAVPAVTAIQMTVPTRLRDVADVGARPGPEAGPLKSAVLEASAARIRALGRTPMIFPATAIRPAASSGPPRPDESLQLILSAGGGKGSRTLAAQMETNC